MASESVAIEPKAAPEPFTCWGRSADDGTLDLWIQRDGRIVESVTLDVTELPQRPDLLARLSPKTRERMLWEAREVAKGNPSLNPHFPGYDARP